MPPKLSLMHSNQKITDGKTFIFDNVLKCLFKLLDKNR